MVEEKKEIAADPRSLVAGKTRHRVDLLQSKAFNRFYDGLTIFISIADVTTDVMVLLSYYNQDRTAFFYTSLVILLLAQFGYVMVFLFTFDIDDFSDRLWEIVDFFCCNYKLCKNANNGCQSCCRRCCLGCFFCCAGFWNSKCGHVIFVTFGTLILGILGLIALSIGMAFGHLVAFLMYFAENEESKIFKFLNKWFGIKKRTRIPLEDKLSVQTKFAIKKINKHGGFILEAFMEALPQSILQLIAMVYYRETNLISIGSILLSMTSIMTKSFVISQGIEWKSYLFCWLCVITDFFSIFFVVSWIFLSNEHINGDFLGYFSIVGELWCYKVGISIIPPIITAFCGWVFVGFWTFAFDIYHDNRSFGESLWVSILWVLLFVIFGNTLFIVGFCICSVVFALFAEIFCFSIIAAFVFVFLTFDRWEYTDEGVSYLVHEMLDFISSASRSNNDRIIRILSLNRGYVSLKSRDSTLFTFIEERRENGTLNTISYKDIRENCIHKREVMIFKTGFKDYFELMNEFRKHMRKNCRCDSDERITSRIERFFLAIGGVLCVYIGIPIYGLSRIFTIIFPYILVVYIYQYELFFKLDLFELTMLGVYIFLQLVVFVCAFFVFRTHFWLWHILPGKQSHQTNLRTIDHKAMLRDAYKYYDDVQWLPFATQVIVRRFGQDIGGIIVEYLKAMQQFRV